LNKLIWQSPVDTDTARYLSILGLRADWATGPMRRDERAESRPRSGPKSHPGVEVLVIPAREDLEIARQVRALLDADVSRS